MPRRADADLPVGAAGAEREARPLLEAVPNCSEGRSPETIRRLIEAARPLLLDAHSDPSHHRSVLTLAGTAGELRRASLRLFEAVLARIDLRRHCGEHPRTGALDVLPIVPLDGAPMVDAVRLARSLGEEIAAAADVPVFLYGHAAPNRRALPEIRRGGLRGLTARLARGAIAPDYGPRRLHPSAGAVSVGARGPLIAFNANLETSDLGLARRIARRLRTSSGGLPALRAIGVAQRDRETGRVLAQVSLNLLDWRRTGLAAVFARLRAEARAVATDVRRSELVGLLPAAACWPGMEEELRLERPPRTIEAAYEAVYAASGRSRRTP